MLHASSPGYALYLFLAIVNFCDLLKAQIPPYLFPGPVLPDAWCQ